MRAEATYCAACLRRAARFGRLLGTGGTFLNELVDTVVAVSGDAYPDLVRKQDSIREIVRIEEERFAETVQAGSALLDSLIREATDGNDQGRGCVPAARYVRIPRWT